MSGFVFFTDVICYCVAEFQVNKSLSLVVTTYNNFIHLKNTPMDRLLKPEKFDTLP